MNARAGVAESQERETGLEAILVEDLRYIADNETPLADLVASIETGGHFTEHSPLGQPVAVLETETLPNAAPYALEGEATLGYARIWEGYGGHQGGIVALTHQWTPIAVLHEMAHLLAIEDGHGPQWVAHFEALVQERYSGER
jgi:hypothetical protein